MLLTHPIHEAPDFAPIWDRPHFWRATPFGLPRHGIAANNILVFHGGCVSFSGQGKVYAIGGVAFNDASDSFFYRGQISSGGVAGAATARKPVAST